MKDLNLTPVKYATNQEEVYIELRNPEQNHWAVTRHGSVLNKDLEFEYEPMPSSRDEDFFNRCRFRSVEEAAQYLTKYQERKAKR
jgi:hypothetical protein